MSNINYSIYYSFTTPVWDLVPRLPRMVQDHFNQVMEDKVYSTPNALKSGKLLKFNDNDDEEQIITPLSIMVECVSVLYKGIKQMRTRVNLFITNIEWDATHILNLKIEGSMDITQETHLYHHPIKVNNSVLVRGDTPAPKMTPSNRASDTPASDLNDFNCRCHLISCDATLVPTPELDNLTNHHLKVLSRLNDKMRWDEHDLLDLRSVSVHAWQHKVFATLKCTVHSIAKEYELLAITYALRWDQVERHAYYFLTKWEAHVSELHAYLQEPWTPIHQYKTLKRASPSDRNALFNSVFILHEQLHGKEQTIKSIANVLQQCYELAAESAPVHLSSTSETPELTTLRAANLINCWACGELGHAANRCPDDTAHTKWKQDKIKARPKSQANACVMLPLEDTREE
ncbi:uncharacterized protein UBRO_20146 [Ustilago bromivora]|uniref:CCHC-type domain-containing protein n=1 Tax=Ustilago bromivora TaxID=307758 RepID=A0A1K0GZD8_9BASI|nr:uncharacterized protein UBRO_20146 [Ustilago bromivora]